MYARCSSILKFVLDCSVGIRVKMGEESNNNDTDRWKTLQVGPTYQCNPLNFRQKNLSLQSLTAEYDARRDEDLEVRRVCYSKPN